MTPRTQHGDQWMVQATKKETLYKAGGFWSTSVSQGPGVSHSCSVAVKQQMRGFPMVFPHWRMLTEVHSLAGDVLALQFREYLHPQSNSIRLVKLAPWAFTPQPEPDRGDADARCRVRVESPNSKKSESEGGQLKIVQVKTPLTTVTYPYPPLNQWKNPLVNVRPRSPLRDTFKPPMSSLARARRVFLKRCCTGWKVRRRQGVGQWHAVRGSFRSAPLVKQGGQPLKRNRWEMANP